MKKQWLAMVADRYMLAIVAINIVCATYNRMEE
jgi:hypothetical protein